jgi:hypothetical protein
VRFESSPSRMGICKKQPLVEVDMDWWNSQKDKKPKATYIEGPVEKRVNGKTRKGKKS